MTVLNMGTGFTGIGVPDLCARLLGIRTVWQIEIDEFCRKVLRKNFPEVAWLYRDIRTVHPCHTDIQVYGFPCQPFSIAGKQLGEQDERYLVPEMLRVIDETRPRVVILENVPRFASLDDGKSFKHLLEALAEMGFDAEWGHIRASDVGAPHTRERWWLVAYPNGLRRSGAEALSEPALHEQRQYPSSERGRQTELYATLAGSSVVENAAVGGDQRFAGWSRDTEWPCDPQWQGLRDEPCDAGELEYTDPIRLQDCDTIASVRETRFPARRLAPGRVEPSGDGVKPRLGRVIDGAADWLDGFTPYPACQGQAQYAFEPPRVTTRKDARAARLKALGNSMAVDVMFEILYSVREWLWEAQP